MQGSMSISADPKTRLTAWIGQHPGIILLAVATLVGLVVLPAVAGAVHDHDVLINGQISAIDLVWLVVALVLCVVCLVARASLSRELGDGLRQLIAGGQKADGAARRGRNDADVPALGATIVRGIFDLIVLLIIQGMVRTPLVGVIGAYEPKAMVDGAFVVVVVVIALLIMFALHRTSQPLTEHLVSVGLDRLVPTAGFAAAILPDAPTTRTGPRTASPSSASRAAASRTGAAGSRPASADQPTVAAGSEGTVAAEATVADTPPAGDLPTIADVPDSSPTARLSAIEATVAPDGATPSDAADSTQMAPPEPAPSPDPPRVAPSTGDHPTPSDDAERTIAPDQTIAPDERGS